MRRTEGAWVLLSLGWAVCALAWPAAAPGQMKVSRSSASGARKPPPLILADDDLGGYVDKAEELIGKADYTRGIEILQALLDRPNPGFIPGADAHEFISLAARVNAVLGKMPAKGLALYRRMHDRKAERLYRRAAATLDVPSLRDIAVRYRHTSHGDDALNLLGAIAFDRGAFAQAARCWGDVLRAGDVAAAERAALLSRMAVAHHFAGETSSAAKALKELKGKHAGAEAVIGGRKQNVAGFTQAVLDKAPPSYAASAVLAEGWFSYAGAPDSVAIMRPCWPVLSPRWTRPGGKAIGNPNVAAIVGAIRFGSQSPYMSSRVALSSATGLIGVALREGRVEYVYKYNNQVRKLILPAIIHPVVASETVIYRAAEGVVAYDLLTGRRQWSTSNHFPIHRDVKLPSSGRYYNPSRYMQMVEDRGHYSLTVAEQKVFAVGKFVPSNMRIYYSPRTGQRTSMGDNSVLAAFSLIKQGALLWRTEEADKADILRGCKFLCAPTCVDGRVYSVVEYSHAYYLVCMNAENGGLVWQAMISQFPMAMAASMYRYGQSWESQGSPPAVADGRVFALTNAGVLAAFDADKGRPLWAYQYDSRVNQAGSIRRSISPGQIGTGRPPNPIVVAKGRVICLPADCESFFAVRADTGRLEWAVKRNGQRDLKAMDDTRLLLSGPGLAIHSVATGQQTWRSARVANVLGRPAVTEDAILASTRGRVVRVDLKDMKVTRQPLVQDDAILGNLVSAGGKLIAGNAAGLSVYSAFEDAHRQLTDRLAKAAPADRPALLYERGMNAFNAKHPDKALPDLLKARDDARQAGDGVLATRAQQALYRTYVSLADKAGAGGDADAMLSLYIQAMDCAYSDRSRGEMTVRLVKHHRANAHYDRAAELAQGLTADFAGIELADVEIGAAADPFVRTDRDEPLYKGYALGHRFVAETLDAEFKDRRTRTCYRSFDAKAKADLAAALTADDPEAMIAVTRTYRHSVHAPTALLRAGEHHYRKALASARTARLASLRQAGRRLKQIVRDYPSSTEVASAGVGLALVRQQKRSRRLAQAVQDLAVFPPATPVAFCEVAGPLGEVIKRFKVSTTRPGAGQIRLAGALALPLVKLYAGTEAAVICRDGQGQPITVNGRIFLLHGNRLTMFDPAAGRFDDGIEWQALLPLEASRLYQGYHAAWACLAAGLGRDGKHLAVATRAGLAGVDIATGKIKWRKTPAQISILSSVHSMVAGDGFIAIVSSSGQMSVVDAATGVETYRPTMSRTQLPWLGPPRIADGMMMICHGNTKREASVFDLAGKRYLGAIGLGSGRVSAAAMRGRLVMQGRQAIRLPGNVRTGQGFLTADGLAVAYDGKSLKLVEPDVDIAETDWSVPLAKNTGSLVLNTVGLVLAVTDEYALVAPDLTRGVVQVHSLDDGSVVQTLQPAATGSPALPVWAAVSEDRAFVVCRGNITNHPADPVAVQCNNPTLHAFDLDTGKRLWRAPLGARNRYMYVTAIQPGKTHLTILAKETSYTRPAVALVIDVATGAVAKEIAVSGAGAVADSVKRRMVYFQHRAMGSPTMVGGRVIVETFKGIEVYGKTAKGQ